MTDESSADEDESTREQRLQQAANRSELDPDALEAAHHDAQLTIEQILQLFSALSDTAFRLIRLNAVVLTILVAVASQVSVGRYVNVPSVAAILLFVVSAVFALFAYLTTTVEVGINTSVFEKLCAYNLQKAEYLNWVLTLGYPAWVATGTRKLRRKERWIRWSLVAFLAGIAMLLVGILMRLYEGI